MKAVIIYLFLNVHSVCCLQNHVSYIGLCTYGTYFCYWSHLVTSTLYDGLSFIKQYNSTDMSVNKLLDYTDMEIQKHALYNYPIKMDLLLLQVVLMWWSNMNDSGMVHHRCYIILQCYQCCTDFNFKYNLDNYILVSSVQLLKTWICGKNTNWIDRKDVC